MEFALIFGMLGAVALLVLSLKLIDKYVTK